VFREPHVGDHWVCRRDASITLPYSELILRTSEGIPYAAPEVALLFKAKQLREKDIADLQTLTIPRAIGGGLPPRFRVPDVQLPGFLVDAGRPPWSLDIVPVQSVGLEQPEPLSNCRWQRIRRVPSPSPLARTRGCLA
jgi:hypothetical protein